MDAPPQPDPFPLFADWMAEAERALPIETARAMALATVDDRGDPWVRYVLLRAYDARGFVFFTNLGSPKARHIRRHARAALALYWPQVDRQVCARGIADPIGDDEADAYFATRSRGSQIGAWASRQSEPLPDPNQLVERIRQCEDEFASVGVPRPPFWSGYRVAPDSVEFWEARPHRLHHRRLFTRMGDQWQMRLLYP